ncbi:MAG: hypothetical protein MJB12_09800 [Firmicutes bacterium]|nr:hypothetical protein [Bacillota bacterium]
MEEILKQILGKLDGLEQRFDGLEQRFDGFEQRFDGFEQRVDGLEQEVKTGFQQTNDRLDKLEKDLKAVYDQVADNTERHTEMMMKMDRVENAVEFLAHKEFENEKEIYFMKRRIREESLNKRSTA